MSNKETLEKMRKSQIGKKASSETKLKMSISHKKLLKNNPDLVTKMLNGAEIKYLSKIRGTSWRALRLKALERDGHQCVSCGERTKRLLVHHLDWQGKRRGVSVKDWNNTLSNLQTLCDKCHNSLHRHKSKDYQDRLRKIAP